MWHAWALVLALVLAQVQLVAAWLVMGNAWELVQVLELVLALALVQALV
jgi:heme/copper-type cytochrome/quinol oxidase subunit 4